MTFDNSPMKQTFHFNLPRCFPKSVGNVLSVSRAIANAFEELSPEESTFSYSALPVKARRGDVLPGGSIVDSGVDFNPSILTVHNKSIRNPVDLPVEEVTAIDGRHRRGECPV